MSKHLTLENRKTIKSMLDQNFSLCSIAKALDRHVSVISREIKNRSISLDVGAYGRSKNRCVHRKDCQLHSICINNPSCFKRCSSCKVCTSICSSFQEEICHLLSFPPYVCNSCKSRSSCVLKKSVYDALKSDAIYRDILVSSREGFNLCEDEIYQIDKLVSPLIKNGQSVRHISLTQAPSLFVSSRTVYRLVNSTLISARNIDMPRVCRMKPRRSNSKSFKVDKLCRLNRSYDDFLTFMNAYSDCPIVEMDTVIGRRGGKLLFTLHLTSFDFMLAFILDCNTSKSVTDSLSSLRDVLSPGVFLSIFPLLLTDNGSEFSNPSAIEFAVDDKFTRVFYCDPSSPYQKPHIELNHEFIRRFLPKGTSFDFLSQSDISFMMSNINSYSRDKFNGLSPRIISLEQ